jgi:hypothetical protein
MEEGRYFRPKAASLFTRATPLASRRHAIPVDLYMFRTLCFIQGVTSHPPPLQHGAAAGASRTSFKSRRRDNADNHIKCLVGRALSMRFERRGLSSLPFTAYSREPFGGCPTSPEFEDSADTCEGHCSWLRSISTKTFDIPLWAPTLRILGIIEP